MHRVAKSCLFLLFLLHSCIRAQSSFVAFEVTYMFTNNAVLKSQADITPLALQLVFTDSMYRYQLIETQNTSEWVKKVSGHKENVLEPYSVGKVGSLVQYKIQNNCITKRKAIVVDSIPSITWEFTGKQKRILNFDCNEAIGVYRGRPIKVYYTSDIPVSLGPYKIIGLPGLVLEMISIDGDFRYLANSIRTLQNLDNFKFNFPDNLEMISLKSQIECSDRYSNERRAMGNARLKTFINNINTNGVDQTSLNITSSVEKFSLELIYEWETPQNDPKKN